jgi:aspartyl-tRNA(Asn)/glutamyl-tRNA(Gln) amidotransferase subunit A
VAAVFAEACKTLATLGANVVEISLPDPAETLAAFVTTQQGEAVCWHRACGLYPDRASEYALDVRRRLEVADRVVLASYIDAQATRQRLRAGWARLFYEVDVVMTPVSAITPPAIGSQRVAHLDSDWDIRDLVMTYTVPQNLVGIPSCAVRAGFDRVGMPVGVQFTGPWGSEARVLSYASAFVGATPHVQRRWPSEVISVPSVENRVITS